MIPRAAPSKSDIRQELKEALIRTARAIGLDGSGRDGLDGYLARLERIKPEVFAGLLAKLIPPAQALPAASAHQYEDLDGDAMGELQRRIMEIAARRLVAAPPPPAEPGPATVSIALDAATAEPVAVPGDIAKAARVLYALTVPSHVDTPTVRGPKSGKFSSIEATPAGRIVRLARGDAAALLDADGAWRCLNPDLVPLVSESSGSRTHAEPDRSLELSHSR
jgi:hypothetical protein